MNKIPFLICFLLSCYARSFAQLPDSTIAPTWQALDVNYNMQNMYNYLNQGKVVILNFATTWSPHSYAYATNDLKTFYSRRGPSATIPQAQIFMLESDPSTEYTCLKGVSTICGSAGSVGDFVTNVNYPIIDNGTASIAKAYLSEQRFPSIYMVCPNKRTFYVGQKTADQLDTLMQKNCGIVPGSPTQALNIVANVTNNKCFGEYKGKIIAQVTGGNEPFTYKWSNNIPTNITNTASNLAAGNYSVTITDKFNQSVTKDVVVSQPSLLTSNPVIADYKKCGAKGAVQLNPTGGTSPYSFNWSAIGTTTQNQINNLTAANTFTVTITDANA